MSDRKNRKFYIDWWEIKTSTIYGVVALLCVVAIIGGGGYWLWKNNWVIQAPTDEAPRNTARIVSFQGDVRIIRVTTRKTENVTKEVYVQAGDTIQTQADGRAQVEMIDGSTLSVRPNSTVIIRDSRSIFGGTSVRVKLDDGQIRVKTEDQKESSDNIVEVRETENRLAAQTDASFNLNDEANRGEIRITRGSIESRSGENKTIIKKDEYATLEGGRVSGKEDLVKTPELLSPKTSERLLTKGSGKSVLFSWKKPDTNSKYLYYLQVSKSPFFVSDKIVVNKTSLADTNFNVSEMPVGVYFWRVQAKAGSGQITEWSEPTRFVIAKQTASSKIIVEDWKVELVGGKLYIINGATKPGATVTISGRKTFARSDGSFSLQISSNSSSVTVEIYDEQGNRGRYNLNLKTGKAV